MSQSRFIGVENGLHGIYSPRVAVLARMGVAGSRPCGSEWDGVSSPWDRQLFPLRGHTLIPLQPGSAAD
eukprot:777861-Pelagomonas_calceolata.AAC.1